jgi:hypothetical protein
VKQNLREFREQAEQGEQLGFAAFDHIRPFGRAYNSGMGAALGVIFKLQRPGWHEGKNKVFCSMKGKEYTYQHIQDIGKRTCTVTICSHR